MQIGYIKGLEIYSILNEKMEDILQQIQKGFSLGYKPKLTDDGTSGTYFLKNSQGQNTAIFKPYDEEPYAPKNPRGYTGRLGQEGFRPGIQSGESATREVAAFLLDNEYGGIYGVPPTTYAEVFHETFFKGNSGDWNLSKIDQELDSESTLIPDSNDLKHEKIQKKDQKIRQFKQGSLQKFVFHHDTVGNFGPSSFSVKEIHKIAILDIRILNCDRNDENILVLKTMLPKQNPRDTKRNYNFSLIPIDHGLSFPDCFEIQNYEINWMEYPQAKVPFTQQELTHIRKIDIEKDVQLLKSKLKFRKKCLRNFKIAGIVLKKCAEANLTLYDIGQIIYKEDPDELSIIEQIILRVENYCQKVNKGSRWNILQLNSLQKEEFKYEQNSFFGSKLVGNYKIEEENESCCESQQDNQEEKEAEINILGLNRIESQKIENNFEKDQALESNQDNDYFIYSSVKATRKERMQSEDLTDYLLQSDIKNQNLSPEKYDMIDNNSTAANSEMTQIVNQIPQKFRIKRSLSNQDLTKLQDDEKIDKQNMINQLKEPYQNQTQNNNNGDKKIKLQKKHQELNEKEEKIQEDLFFRCFVNFLEYEIQKYSKIKNK